MITSVTSAPAAQTSSQRAQLGKNEFLTLLVTQLRNQDPLSPLQPHEFAAQLAQFTSVEQLTQLNEAVLRQSDALDLQRPDRQDRFGAALIGRQRGGRGQPGDGRRSGRAARARRHRRERRSRHADRSRDSSGREVATRELGKLPAGRQTLELPAGLCRRHLHYTIKVKDADDKAVPVTAYTTGVVDGVVLQERRDRAADRRDRGSARRRGRDRVRDRRSAPSPPPSEADPISIPTGEPPVRGRRRGP